MKIYIFIILCIAFSVDTLAQESVTIVHKKNGEKVVLDDKLESQMNFFGKAVVNDDDYVMVEESALGDVTFFRCQTSSGVLMKSRAVLNVELQGKGFGVEGICYSTMPGVTIDNGMIADVKWYNSDPLRSKIYFYLEMNDIDIDTDYYYRVYTHVEGKVYYSSEHHFNVGRPSMACVVNDNSVVPDIYDKGVICPTDEAWEKFCARFPYFNTKSWADLRNKDLFEQWKEGGFAKVEDFEAGKMPDSMFVCSDGIVYYVDEVPDSFVDAFMFDEVKIDGWDYCEDDDDNRGIGKVSKIECDEIYGVPGNAYAVITPSGSSITNPAVIYLFKNLLLSNYKYNIEVIMAPETREGIVKKINKFIASLWKPGTTTASLVDEEGESIFRTDSLECTTFSFDIVPVGFGMYRIKISGLVGLSMEQRRENSTRELRIVGIRVKPVGPVEEDVQE